LRSYDTYTPTKTIVFHDYGEQLNGHGNDEWFENQRDRFRKLAIDRAGAALQMPSQDGVVPTSTQLANLGLYGVGKRRGRIQLEEFTKINIEAKVGNNAGKDCLGQTWVPYDATISPVENLFDKPDQLDPQPEYPQRTKLVFYEQVAFEVPKLELNFSEDAASDYGLRHGDALPLVEGHTSSFPSSGSLFVFWTLGLMIWCYVFAIPGAGKTPVRKKKSKDNLAKDV
jgi:hypothetical protein